jgi:hypothetical protein
MSLKPFAVIAALFSSLVLVLMGFIYLKPSTTPVPQRAALPPVEIVPPVRDVTPQTPTSIQAAPVSPRLSPPPEAFKDLPKESPMPLGVTLIQNDAILKPNVRRMRERLIEAAQSGNINRLSIVFQTNETQPIFTRGTEKDPVAFWKKASGDGQGREILSALSTIMTLPAAHIHKGTPQEMYVWPYLAHVSLNTLSPMQEVDLYKLLTAQDVKDMVAYGKWVHWRVGIGPDGTLHYFVAGE